MLNQEHTPRTELPAWLYLWLPVASVSAFLLINLIDSAFFLRWVESELGVLELATPAILLPGVYFGIQAVRHGRLIIDLRVRAWIGLVTLGCIYFAGEELSWGQWLFGWQTPELLRGVNDQNETNIHNISSWFDQKPRLLLEIWVLVGGVILPIGRMLNNSAYPEGDWRYWFWPTTACLPVSLIAILIKLPERIKDVFGLGSFSFELRWSEVQELYFAGFLCLYLYSVLERLRQQHSDPQAQP